ncbi:MAG: HD domain-containing protein [Lachnospiraceae bacterium]|nr:HD domain-containing protein [Lachnospiraceae bacterium]
MEKKPVKHPNDAQCRALWDQYETPEHIRKHCEAVALVACAIGSALNDAGKNLDIDLIYAAGMLHDLVRLSKDHEKEGAEIMRGLGYDGEADIISVHMHYDPFSQIEEVTETDMVCLGDRTVIEHGFVGVNRRYQHIIDKAIRMGRPEAEAVILEKRVDVYRFVNQIEELTGKSLEDIVSGVHVD